MNLTQVPTIDISQYATDQAARIASEIDDAFRNIGFITIVGHGVDPKIVSDVELAAQRG